METLAIISAIIGIITGIIGIAERVYRLYIDNKGRRQEVYETPRSSEQTSATPKNKEAVNKKPIAWDTVGLIVAFTITTASIVIGFILLLTGADSCCPVNGLICLR